MRKPLFIALLITFLVGSAVAQTTVFTYQGSLKDGANLPTANYDFEFRLYSAIAGGLPIATLQRLSVPVSNGTFTVQLDFGGQFPGFERFIEISVRPAGGGSFTPLLPRQAITNTPYAIRSHTATNADNAVNSQIANNALSLGFIPANQYVVTTDPRLSDARPPTAGSGNYIQNSTTQQTGSFNISGNGTSGGTLSGNIVNAATQFNLGGQRVLGGNPAVGNLFVGAGSGDLLTGGENSFFGVNSGKSTTSGAGNSFFGFLAGFFHYTGSYNSFFGQQAGRGNVEGLVTGSFNSYFGHRAGENTTSGNSNSVFGTGAGLALRTGSQNSFFGHDAGNTIFAGSLNTMVGDNADAVSDLTNSTAIGANAFVTQSDSLILGSINGTNGATADTRVGIGTTAPTALLTLSASSTNSGENTATFKATNIGANASHIHFGASGDWYIRSAAAGGKVILQDTGGNVGIGTALPDQRLSVNGNASKVGGGSWVVFSDERLKNVNGTFRRGLADLMRLNPIRFEYRSDNALGLRGDGEYIGFNAQEVLKVIPEAVSESTTGYLQLNNDPIIWTTLNAVKEQQAQIESLKKQVETLRALVCTDRPTAEICAKK